MKKYEFYALVSCVKMLLDHEDAQHAVERARKWADDTLKFLETCPDDCDEDECDCDCDERD